MLDLDGHAAEVVRRGGVQLEIEGLDEPGLTVVTGEQREHLGRADAVAAPVAEALARQLAGYRLATGALAQDLDTVEATLPALLGSPDAAALDLERLWRPRPLRDRLRAPIGIAADGSVLELDLKEAAQDGMGPHGLLVGATGSGKSELLRTLVLGLAATHPPDVLNMVLVDFKGGATFAGMSRLGAGRRGDHEPAGRRGPGRPHAPGALRRAQPAPGAPAGRGQPRLRPRLRAGPAARRGAGPAAQPAPGRRRVLRADRPAGGVRRAVRADRPPGPLAGPAPAAGQPAPGGGQDPGAGGAPVVPDRAAHLLPGGEPRRPRGGRGLHAAQLPGSRPAEDRHHRADPLPHRLRLGPLRRRGRAAGRAARRAERGAPVPGVGPARSAAPGRPCRGTGGRGRSRPGPPCSA